MISLPLYSFLSSLRKSLITVWNLYPWPPSSHVDLKWSQKRFEGLLQNLLWYVIQAIGEPVFCVCVCDENFRRKSETKILDENFRQKFQTKISDKNLRRKSQKQIVDENLRQKFQTKISDENFGRKSQTKILDENLRRKFQTKI